MPGVISKSVADAPDGFDVNGRSGVRLDLFADAVDVNHDGRRVAEGVHAPDAVEELVLAESDTVEDAACIALDGSQGRREIVRDGREEDVGEDFPYIVQRIFFLWRTRVERDAAARDDDDARFLCMIMERTVKIFNIGYAIL